MRARLYVTVLAALVTGACEEPTAPNGLDAEPAFALYDAGGVAQSISGSWAIEGTRTFAFNAERRLDGSVTGAWQRVNQPFDRQEGGTVVCFAIEGNEVWVGTRTTHGPTAGTDGWFRALDGGEGPDAIDGVSGHAVGRPVGSASQYCNLRPDGPGYQTVGAGEVQIRGRTPPDLPGPDPVLLATIEWPFTSFERAFVPPEAEIDMFYNGYYNTPPCTNAETTLTRVSIPWGTAGFVHRYDRATDAGFAGFVDCLTNGTDETLSFGVEQVSGWAVEESIALDVGLAELEGRSVAFAELEVDELSTAPSAGGLIVAIVMRWRFYGS